LVRNIAFSPKAWGIAAAVVAVLTLVVAPRDGTSAVSSCAGDCRGDGTVTVTDLITLVDIALGHQNVGDCSAGDTDNNDAITIDEIVGAAGTAVGARPPGPTATPSNTPRAPTQTRTPTASATPTGTSVTGERCGDGMVNQPGEECDPPDDAMCPGQCR